MKFNLFVLSLLLFACSGIVGCANPIANVDQAVIAGDAVTKSANTLLINGTITQADAKAVLLADLPALAAANAFLTAYTSGDTNAIATASTAVQASLTALSNELVVLSQSPKVAAARKVGYARAAVKVNKLQAKSKKTGIDPASIIAIVQLVAEITPSLTEWINNAVNSGSVTVAQLQTDIAAWQADIVTLQNGAAGSH